MFDEFLKSAAGHAVVGVLIAALAVLIIDLNYRLFFKYVLDFIFALVFVTVLSPVFIGCAAVSKYREGRVYDKTPCLGARGKVIFVRSYAGVHRSFKNLARVLDVIAGRLSFVGPRLMPVSDGAFLSDEAMQRFATRPGVLCYLAARGGEGLTYEQMFALDARYAKKRELFYDIFAVLAAFALAIRGEGGAYLGESASDDYAHTLLKRGAIGEKEIEQAEKIAEEAIEEHEKRRQVKKSKYGA